MARKPSGPNKRKLQRQSVQYVAWVKPGEDQDAVKCQMKDVSTGGARLVLARETTVPDEFLLYLTESGSISRPCRVAWRTDAGIGVQFLG